MSCAANARLTEARVTNKAGDLSALAYKSCHVSSRRDKSVYTGGGVIPYLGYPQTCALCRTLLRFVRST